MTLKERLAQLEAVASKDRTVEEKTELKQVRADIATEDAVRAKKEAEDKVEMDSVRAENKELKRVASINETADLYKPSAELRTKFVAGGSVDEFTRAILAELSEKNETVRVGTTPDRANMLTQLGDAVASRMGVDVDLKGNQFASARFSDIARAITGDSANFGLSNADVANRAMATKAAGR